MRVIAVRVLPSESRAQWAECWRADLRDLARGDDGYAWLAYSCRIAIAAAKIRLDRGAPDSWWARVIVWRGGAIPRGTAHVTPCPQSPASDGVRPEQKGERS